MTNICVSKLTIIGSDNGLSPDRRQPIIWTSAGLLFIGPLGTNFSEILNKILTFSFKKMRLKVSSAKRQPFCLGRNVLMNRCHCQLIRRPASTNKQVLIFLEEDPAILGWPGEYHGCWCPGTQHYPGLMYVVLASWEGRLSLPWGVMSTILDSKDI